MSLRPTGTPASAPLLSPCWMACSQRLAAARAPCRSTLTHACNVGSRASRRVRQAVTTSTGETSRRCTSAATSATPIVCNAVMVMLPHKRLANPHDKIRQKIWAPGQPALGSGQLRQFPLQSGRELDAGVQRLPHPTGGAPGRRGSREVLQWCALQPYGVLPSLWQTQPAFPNNIELNLIRARGHAIASGKEALKRPVSIGHGVLGTLIELRVGTQDLFGDLHRAHIHTREGQFLDRAFRARRFPTQLFGEGAEACEPL